VAEWTGSSLRTSSETLSAVVSDIKIFSLRNYKASCPDIAPST
jgi:hypothetical protein